MFILTSENNKKLRQNAFFQTKSIQNQLKATEWTTTTFKKKHHQQTQRIKWGRTTKKTYQGMLPIKRNKKRNIWNQELKIMNWAAQKKI